MSGGQFLQQVINAERWYHQEVRRLEEQGFKRDEAGQLVSPDGNTVVVS